MLFFWGGGTFNQFCRTMHCYALSCRLYEDIGGLWLHEAVATLACSSTQAPPPANAPAPPTNLSFSSSEEGGTAGPFYLLCSVWRADFLGHAPQFWIQSPPPCCPDQSSSYNQAGLDDRCSLVSPSQKNGGKHHPRWLGGSTFWEI